MGVWVVFGGGALFVMACVYPFYAGKRYGGHFVLGVAVKGLGTLVAAGLALYGTLRMPEASSWLIAVGLEVCVLADMVLTVHFPAGTGLFFLAHLLYLGGLLRLAPFQPAIIVVLLLLYGIVLVWLFPYTRRRNGLIALYLAYGSLLLLMVSVALLLPAQLGTRGFVVAAAAVLFALSDLLIARGAVKKPLKHQSYAVMGLYYAAQLLFSLVALQPWS